MRAALAAIVLAACSHPADGPPAGIVELATWTPISGIAFHEIALDDTHVYWTTDRDVRLVPKNGGDTEIVAADQTEASGIAVDATTVYWTVQEDGEVRSAPIGGGAATTLVTGQDRPTDLVVDGNNLYWLTRGSGGDGAVMTVALAGGTPTAVASQKSYLTGLDLDATHVYWVDTDAGAVERAPIAGGAASTIASATQPWKVAVAGDTAYWTARTAIQGGPVTGGWTELASGQTQAHAIAVDDTDVYWTDLVYWNLEGIDGGVPGGAVRRVARDGGAVATLAADQNGPTAIAIDEDAVYWINDPAGALLRAPK